MASDAEAHFEDPGRGRGVARYLFFEWFLKWIRHRFGPEEGGLWCVVPAKGA